ncbi:DHA2 family efflux MFS transporter permease subunit [Sneathiella sp.]|jgi:EmrB/QacA subfamily drug resistance transporter|uniref:DHA2 family efflux MFS transporter permease subunit n=1 Tax=Sneathiella sp. TaxID=1964365 RepID=UPI0039E49F6C
MINNRHAILQEKYGTSYKWLAGFAVVIGLLTTIFSSTMITVALTDIMSAFDITQGSVQWMATGFLCASSVAMLTTSWFMRTLGARLTFMIASSLFIVGSFMGWLSPNFETLVAARILQGAGAGIIQPLSMALVFILFPPDVRGRAMGWFGMGVVLGPALGPLIGGIVTDALDWHTTFLVALPLSILSVILGFIFLPDRSKKEDVGQFNFVSFFLIMLGVGGLLSGLSNSQFHSFSHVTVFPNLCVSLIAFILFFRRELSSSQPLVQLDLFKSLIVVSTAMIGAFTSAGLFSSVYALPLFARSVQRMNATDAGLVLFPAGVALVIIFPIVGRLVDKLPAYKLIVVGQIVFIISMIILSFSTRDTGYLALAGWSLVSRVALGAIMPTNSTFSLSSVPPSHVTQASSAFNFIRMLGGTLGVNLTALLITNRMAQHTMELKEMGRDVLADDSQIQIMTLTFQDSFLFTGLVFCLAIIPTLYIAYHTRKVGE